MAIIKPISDAKIHLSALVAALDGSEDERVVLLRHGTPAAVMLSADAYNALVEALDDAEDRLSLYEAEDEETVDFEKAVEMMEM